MLTIDFLANGGDTYYGFKSASSNIDTGMLMDDAVSEYLEKKLKGVIGEEYADAAGRIHIIAADANAANDAEQTEANGGKAQASEPAAASADLAADGKWGPLTTQATQKVLSEEEDGLLGPDTVRAIQKKARSRRRRDLGSLKRQERCRSSSGSLRTESSGRKP